MNFRTLATSPIPMAALLLLTAASQAQSPALQERFERKVAEYVAEDQAHPAPRGAILFAGDSQFYRWTTIHEDLPGYSLVNRGIDSFQTSDLIRYADRLITPYQPRLIVLHVGGNDIHGGKSPAQLLADFKTLAAAVHAKLPGVKILWSSITPGPGRWDEAPQRREANRVMKEYIATQPDLGFIDLWDAMLTPDGKPREDIWVADRVHPNHAGYLIRVKITQPFLGRPDK
jgi:lysophospholipase L1-like esterase